LVASSEKRIGVEATFKQLLVCFIKLISEKSAIMGEGRKKVLVVDDQDDIRRLYSIALAEHFDVDQAPNAITAFEHIVNFRPSAVVLDIRMPGRMSGIELCRHIKQNDAFDKICVVIVSGWGHLYEHEILAEFGADAFFEKPVSPGKLVDFLKNALA
jgi:DNA-binding response OmpR family regulator